MRSLFFLFLLIFFSIMSPPSSARNQIVYFESKDVELKGVIRVLKFPGAPNYESIRNGDEDETGGYLILNHPIDINLKSNTQNENDEPVKNVKFIQLMIHNENDWKKIKEGNYVHVMGTLLAAQTGHHHARILIRINKINILSKEKIDIRKYDVSDEDRQFLKYQHLQN
ncbi:MAG: DUF4431 domain-containing protein [Gammaproteobacteria bacterium]|nr:DUF4431 domain-containing protein [Gammaproteobacteria bacterium]